MSNSVGQSERDLNVALGCIIYDALILAVAIQMRGTRLSRPKVANLNWTEAQIAIEVILLKLRGLEDFLMSRVSQPDDIRALDFGYAPSSSFEPMPQTFRDVINKRSAHLTWRRAVELLPDFSEVDEGLDVYAGRVMTEVLSFVRSTIAEGIAPSLDRHKAYLEALKTVYAQIESSLPGMQPRGDV